MKERRRYLKAKEIAFLFFLKINCAAQPFCYASGIRNANAKRKRSASPTLKHQRLRIQQVWLYVPSCILPARQIDDYYGDETSSSRSLEKEQRQRCKEFIYSFCLLSMI